jgi:hypothetical protein
MPCLSLCRLVSWDLFREVSSEKCWGQSSTWICLQGVDEKAFYQMFCPPEAEGLSANSLPIFLSAGVLGFFSRSFVGKVLGAK